MISREDAAPALADLLVKWEAGFVTMPVTNSIKGWCVMYEHSTVKVTRRGLWPSLGK
jgi:hypothetical protein